MTDKYAKDVISSLMGGIMREMQHLPLVLHGLIKMLKANTIYDQYAGVNSIWLQLAHFRRLKNVLVPNSGHQKRVQQIAIDLARLK